MVPNGRTPWKSGVWHRVFINAIQAMMMEGIAILKSARHGEEGRRARAAGLPTRAGIGIGIGIENVREEEPGSIPIPIPRNRGWKMPRSSGIPGFVTGPR